MEMIVNGKKHILLSKDDKCPICQTAVKDMAFSWGMFHGEADSSCCGATYQIKDFHIESPSDEQQQYLEYLKNGYIDFKIKHEWVEPLQIALKEVGATNIKREDVLEAAERHLPAA